MHSIPININHRGSYFGSLHKRPVKPNIIDAILGYEKDDVFLKQIIKEEFRNTLNGLNTNKASGYDDIPAVILKSFWDQLVTFSPYYYN